MPVGSLTSPRWREIWTSRHMLVERIEVCLRRLHRPGRSPNQPTYSGLGPHGAPPPVWLTKLLRAMSGSPDAATSLGTCGRWPQLTACRAVGSREATPGGVMVLQVAGSPSWRHSIRAVARVIPLADITCGRPGRAGRREERTVGMGWQRAPRHGQPALLTAHSSAGPSTAPRRQACVLVALPWYQWVNTPSFWPDMVKGRKGCQL